MMSIPPLSKPLFNTRISKLHDVNSTIIQTTVQLKVSKLHAVNSTIIQTTVQLKDI